MALKNTICVVVHHACQTQAHFQTMVSSFKLLSGTVCLPRFCRITGQIYRGQNVRLVGFYQMHCFTGRSGIVIKICGCGDSDSTTVTRRVVESDSSESNVLERIRSTFFRFDEVGVAERNQLFRLGRVGN